MNSVQPSTSESARLESIRRYDVLDTPPDGCFDRITAFATRRFGVPIAIVSVVDEDRIWFKSRHGVEVDEIDRNPGLCASAILQDDAWVLNDARSDPRALANPLVAGEFGLRFYAGVPLTTPDGHNLGTLCVIDREPREFSDSDRQELKVLADVVMDELELRRAAREAVGAEHELRQEAQGLARELQQSLLPASLPSIPRAELAPFFRPASSAGVGGDFYDCFEVGPRRWLTAVGDVTGKGPKAAAASNVVRYAVRTAASNGEGAAAAIATANRALVAARRETEDRFASLAVVEISTADHGFELSAASAGHPPVLITSADDVVEGLVPPGPLLGVFADPHYEAGSGSLSAGDALVLYTDGLSEARVGDGYLGSEGISKALLASRAGTAADICATLAGLAGDEPDNRDDVVILVVKALAEAIGPSD